MAKRKGTFEWIVEKVKIGEPKKQGLKGKKGRRLWLNGLKTKETIKIITFKKIRMLETSISYIRSWENSEIVVVSEEEKVIPDKRHNKREKRWIDK